MNANFWNGILADHAASMTKAQRASRPNTYRGWDIWPGRWPEPNWKAAHKDYDASWEGEEDGWRDNGLSTDADTYDALLAEIDAIMDEHPHFKGEQS